MRRVLPATIFAPATGRGKSAIAILRISGPSALSVWHRMTAPPAPSLATRTGVNSTKTRDEQSAIVNFQRNTKDEGEGRMMDSYDPIPRRAHLRKIVDPVTRETLDEGIVLYFPPTTSLTAQPTLELHTHGSPALMNLLLRRLATFEDGFRIAEPGEFTRLAFEAGKMDLTQVEGLRDLVESDTETQRKLAARQAGGQMSKKYNAMRKSIIESSALIEALIDFGEDEGISEGVYEQARSKVLSLQKLIAQALDDGRRGEIIRAGIQLAIIGAPNAGKSTLLNWLVQREAAIVSPTPGTTRDIIELSLDFHGYPLTIADTAGLRAANDAVEKIGVERAVAKAHAADLKLCLLALPSLFPQSLAANPLRAHIDPLTLSLIDSNTIIILSQTDRVVEGMTVGEEHLEAIAKTLGRDDIGARMLQISVKNGDGMEQLVERLKEVLKERYDLSDELEDTPIVTSARHRRHLEECLQFLTEFLTMTPDDIVLAAEELRYAILSLGRITGAVDVEEVLGEIFSGFCIGK